MLLGERERIRVPGVQYRDVSQYEPVSIPWTNSLRDVGNNGPVESVTTVTNYKSTDSVMELYRDVQMYKCTAVIWTGLLMDWLTNVQVY